MPLKVTVVDKPIVVNGISLTDIPEDYITLYQEHVPAALKEEKELQFDADTKDEAEKAAAYARVWGMRQDPKLELRRVASKTQGQPATRVRLTVKLFDPNAPRPGRPASDPAAATSGGSPKK
jgi:hypothetical protein